jgi:hypothetical protein
MGALSEALDAEQRPRLVELLGIDFDFTALIEVDDVVREEILDELLPQTVAKGGKRDRIRRRRSDPRGPADNAPRFSIRSRRPNAFRSLAVSNIRSILLAGVCRRNLSLCRRIGMSARPSTSCVKRRNCRSNSMRSMWWTRAGRLKFDPAVASSPFVTTVTDVVGFFSFLSIASRFGLR